MKQKTSLDDTLDVFRHGVGGIVGNDPHRRIRQWRGPGVRTGRNV